jgi:5'-nucleotidase
LWRFSTLFECFIGSCDVFSKLVGSNGKDVLYVGDHIYGDIIRAKKEVAWRTFLIVPELGQELQVWKENADLFVQLQSSENELADRLMYI